MVRLSFAWQVRAESMPRPGPPSGGSTLARLPRVAGCRTTTSPPRSSRLPRRARNPTTATPITADDAAAAVVALLARGRDRGARRVASCASPTRPAPTTAGSRPHTVVEVVSDDAPFLVDSVSTALVRHGYDLHLVFRPLLDVDDVGPTSHLHLEIDRETDHNVLDALAPRWRTWSTTCSPRSPTGTRCATPSPTSPARSGASPPDGVTAEETAEVATYLDWLADDHFTFVGAVAIDASGGAVPGSELGVARRRPLFDLDDVDPSPTGLLTLTRAQVRSTVHRDVPLDSVTVRRLDADGTADGELRLLGLYTANVFSDSVEHIPVVRHKVAEVLARSGFAPDGHDGRTLEHVLATYPRDEMFRLVDRRARRADDGDRGHGVATPGAAVREPRPGRVLRVVPRVPAARPLHDAGAQVGRRCAVRRVQAVRPPTSPSSSPRS